MANLHTKPRGNQLPATMPNSVVECICSVIRARATFVLVTHREPDGDGIGSALALWHALRDMGKGAIVYIPEELPAKFKFLPGADEVAARTASAEVLIALDCDDEERLGCAVQLVHQAEVVIDIDHHAGHRRFGHISWCDVNAPAVGFQVFQLLKVLGVQFSPAIATCLYCAVGTDSGYFRYANTSAELLRVAAELVEFGADPKAIAEATLDRFAPEVVRLAGRALANLRIRLGGRVALAVLTREDYEQAGTEQTEGIIDYLRSVAGVEVLVLMRQVHNGWRVSLRSLGNADVGQVGRELGGGGHAPASGCTLQGSLNEAWDTLASQLEVALGRSGYQ